MAKIELKKNFVKKEETSENIENRQSKKKRNGEKAPMQEYRPGHYMTPDWENRHAELQVEINKNHLPFENFYENGVLRIVTISSRRFQKTAQEHAAVKAIIKKHRAECRKFGVNPKKQMNVTIGELIAYKERLGKKYKIG